MLNARDSCNQLLLQRRDCYVAGRSVLCANQRHQIQNLQKLCQCERPSRFKRLALMSYLYLPYRHHNIVDLVALVGSPWQEIGCHCLFFSDINHKLFFFRSRSVFSQASRGFILSIGIGVPNKRWLKYSASFLGVITNSCAFIKTVVLGIWPHP